MDRAKIMFGKRQLQLFLCAATASMALPAMAETRAADMAALEARIAQLEAASVAAAPQARDRLRINGFISGGFARVDTADFSYEGLTDEWSHNADSMIGIQLDAAVNERARAMVQLTARGTDAFAVEAEWAYIGIKVTDSDELRIGRQRYPFFMLSEYLEVGYSHPWAKPPLEVYQPGMPSSLDAIAWKRVLPAGDWSHDIQAFWGSTAVNSSTGRLRIDDSMGLGVQSSTGNWLFSASYTRSSLSLDQPLLNAFTAIPALGISPLTDRLGWYAGLGAQYDDGKLLLMLEATRIRVDGYLPDSKHVYSTIGYRFGKVMPHLTWASKDVQDSAERALPALPGLCPGFCLDSSSAPPVPFPADTLTRMLDNQQDSLTLGVRYDFLPRVALKVDWTRVLDTHGTFGNFDRLDGDVFYGALPPRDIDVYRVAVDAVF